ncbi:MAG: sugar ABC transporter permease, partial [Trueperaceae bacterium]|nr:sugar ABC transporter permease [Trueperaceae bacterium]
VESFNAFYAGVVRNDPVGPLMYVIPALLGFALCVLLLANRDHERRPGAARALAEPLVALLALALVVRLVVQGVDGFFGKLEAGTWRTLVELMTFQNVLREPGELAYLRTGFSAHTPSALWIVAILAVVLLVVGRARLPQRTQDVLLGVLGFGFLLLAAGSFQGGISFFKAFDEVAAASGGVNHHFALFRQATAAFPDSNRVPLWLSSELWSKPSLILITMWSSGAGMLIFLAALKGVPRALYEAADVDGATAWQKFWRVTLPMISPAMFYNVVIGLIAALQTFESVYIIQNTQTESSLASAAYFLFVRTFRQLEIGQGAAASWILAVIIVLLTVAQFRYSRWVHYE